MLQVLVNVKGRGNVLVLVLVCLHPMTHVGSLWKCPAPDVVPPLAGILLFAVLGVLHHFLSVASVCIFETAHCFRSFYVPRDQVPGFYNSSLGRYVFGSEISYNKAPPRLPGLGC